MIEFKNFFDSDLNPKWDYIESIPELAALKECKQSLYWHLEGNPWEHTKLVVNNAITLIKERDSFPYDLSSKYNQEALLMAALFHDVAKPVTTIWDNNKNDWTSPFHAEIGSKMTRKILFNWNDVMQRELIVSLVRSHMMMHHILDKKDNPKGLYRFCTYNFGSACTFDLAAALCWCDDMGSICLDEPYNMKQEKANNIMSTMTKLQSNGFIVDFPSVGKKIAQQHYYGRDYNDDETEFSVYLLIGLPGSGKSTWCHEMGFLPVVSRDSARASLGFCKKGEKYVGSQKEEDTVTKEVNGTILKLASEKKSFIIDNTHLKQKYRDAIHELLKGYKAQFVYVYVEAPTLEETIIRRKIDGFGSKSSDIINQMLMGFEFPFPYEYDELIFEKQKE